MTPAQTPHPRTRPPVQAPSYTRDKGLVALALTFVAGFVDIAGLITLYDVFTAHMTGTTVHMGEHIVQRDWHAVIITGVVLASFVTGSILGRVVIEIGSRSSIKRIASVTLIIELVLLVGVMLLGTHFHRELGSAIRQSVFTVSLLLAMLALAMGLQTATLTRVGALTVHTTFVTGMLNKLAQLVSHVLFRSYDLLRASGHAKSDLESERRVISRQAAFLFLIWCTYLFGAVCGTWLTYRWSFRSLLLPAAVLIGAVLADIARPFSIEEEHEQWER